MQISNITDDIDQNWVWHECKRVLESISCATPEKGYVLFETGYGPSGLPHIGTFGETVRTVMVMNAFRKVVPDIPVRLFVFSDDMDGLRKIPDNIPNPDVIRPFLGRPLTSVPDPFGQFGSYGAYMNNRLKGFLDELGVLYEFKSATECYKSGLFNDAIKRVLSLYDDVKELVLPILGEERQKTYHPILPICKKTGRVIIADIKAINPMTGTIQYEDEVGEWVESSALDGNVKMQWKIDWGLRWTAFDVNYEMHGKDLDSSADISCKLCRLLRKQPPVLFRYEMFLDKDGKKISKSKGNGLTVEDWLKYAPIDTLKLYMYMHPHKSKRLSLDVIPRMIDDYLRYSEDFFSQTEPIMNPLWHIYNGNPPKLGKLGITFAMMLNLVCACNNSDIHVLRKFVAKSVTEDVTDEGSKLVDELMVHAIRYYDDVLKGQKKFRAPSEQERRGLEYMAQQLDGDDSDDYQELALSSGENAGYERANMRPWFQGIYEVLFGQENGPRIGTFIELYGKDRMARLIREKLI